MNLSALGQNKQPIWACVGDTVRLDLEAAGKDTKAVSEADARELGYSPTQALVNEDLVVSVHIGKLYDVGLR